VLAEKARERRLERKFKRASERVEGSLGWGLGEEILADKHKQVQGT